MSSFDRSSSVALLMLGTPKAKGGMFQYFSAWADSLTSQNRLGGVVGVSEVVHEIGSTNSYVFDTEIDRVGYEKYSSFILLNHRRFAQAIKLLSEWLIKNEIEEVWIVDDFLFSSCFVRMLVHAYSGRVRVTIHDPVPHEGHTKSVFSNALYRFNRWRLRKMAINGKIVLHFHERSLIRGSSWDFIHSTVFESHPYPRALTRRHRMQDGKFSLVFAGRIEPYKGLDVLFDAMESLEQRSPSLAGKISIVVAGRGHFYHPYATTLRNSNRAEFLNRFLEDHEFHQVIADADCLVLPYISATSSGVALLALTYNIPLIVTDVGDLPRIAGQHPHGFIVRPNDVASLQQGIERVLGMHETFLLSPTEKKV